MSPFKLLFVQIEVVLYFFGVFPDSTQAEIPPLDIVPGPKFPYFYHSFFHQTFPAHYHSKEIPQYLLEIQWEDSSGNQQQLQDKVFAAAVALPSN